jgi:hypothetical protein
MGVGGQKQLQFEQPTKTSTTRVCDSVSVADATDTRYVLSRPELTARGDRDARTVLPRGTFQDERLRSVFDVRNAHPSREHQLLSDRSIVTSCFDAFQQCFMSRTRLCVVVHVDHLIGQGGHAADRKDEYPYAKLLVHLSCAPLV